MGMDGPDSSAARSTTVWMVNKRTGLDGLKGRLSVEDGAVLFRPDRDPGDETAILLSDIRTVRRVLGSPVLEIKLGPGVGQRLMGFYFIKPPSLAPPKDAGMLRRRYGRKAATERLREWNRVKKQDVAAWVDLIRSAQRAG
jgi:hypothetical protein